MGKAFWIDKAIKKPGALRKSLHVKKGAKIPITDLGIKKGDSSKTKKRKNLAKTLRSFH